MTKIRYQTFLLTRILQGNAFPTTKELLNAINAACAIPESNWATRKAAFNSIAEKAPLRSGDSCGLAITHSDIPGYIEREWYEFSSYSNATRNITREEEFQIAAQKFWLTDKEMGYGQLPGEESELTEETDSSPRM
eukprot:gene19850-23779_t